jgi:hypothetical protein
VYDAVVDPANARAIAILERFRRSHSDRGPVQLRQEYLQAVERLEALSENRAGVDKSWVERSRRDFREYLARVQRRRPSS